MEGRKELSSQDGEAKQTKKGESDVDPVARMVGLVVAGSIEAGSMYVFDKFKNRRQMGAMPIKPTSYADGVLQTVIAPHYKSLTHTQKLRSTFKGVTPYLLHKILARYGVLGIVQPQLMDGIRGLGFYAQFAEKVGNENAKVAAAAVAGGAGGITEVFFNPIDRAKVLCQKKNITAFQAAQQMAKEGLRPQYAGSKETMIRNFPGTAALFFGKFATYKVMKVVDHNNPTLVESLTSSLIGAWMRVFISHLPDVAKVRAQEDPSVKMGMMKRLSTIAKKEGPGALRAGLVSKMLGTGIKLALAVTIADMFVRELNRYAKQKESLQNSSTLFAVKSKKGSVAKVPEQVAAYKN